MHIYWDLYFSSRSILSVHWQVWTSSESNQVDTAMKLMYHFSCKYSPYLPEIHTLHHKYNIPCWTVYLLHKKYFRKWSDIFSKIHFYRTFPTHRKAFPQRRIPETEIPLNKGCTEQMSHVSQQEELCFPTIWHNYLPQYLHRSVQPYWYISGKYLHPEDNHLHLQIQCNHLSQT